MSTPRTRLDTHTISREVVEAWPNGGEWTPLRELRWRRLVGELKRAVRTLAVIRHEPRLRF